MKTRWPWVIAGAVAIMLVLPPLALLLALTINAVLSRWGI
jgi:hypothetical protein